MPPTSPRGLVVRPLAEQDLGAVAELTGDAALAGHLLRTDPGGCWAAEDGTGLLAGALSARRELTWVLAVRAAVPGARGGDALDQLMGAVAAYGQGCLRGALVLDSGPVAARRAHAAGFTLHPTMALSGYVDRAALPVVDRVRDGDASDLDLLDSVDRQVRGAGHGPDHAFLLGGHRLRVLDRSTGSGYAYLGVEGAPVLLAATTRRAACDLLWDALAATAPERRVTVEHVTSVNGWALDVGLAAGLEVGPGGYLALRGIRPPPAYLPHTCVF